MIIDRNEKRVALMECYIQFSQTIQGRCICSHPSDLSVFTSPLTSLLPVLPMVNFFPSSNPRFSTAFTYSTKNYLYPLLNHHTPSCSQLFQMCLRRKPLHMPIQLLYLQSTHLSSVNYILPPS